MAHRAVMNGDFIYAGYTFDPNVEDDVNEYQFYLRWSGDGGRTWSTPMSTTADGPASVNVIEPRLVRAPGTIKSGDPRDVHDPDVYLVAWGTESIAPDGTPYRDSLFVTRTVDRGLSFERAQALGETRTSPDQTDEQIQLRVTPDGQNVSAVWIRKDSTGSSVMFASAVGITPTADLSVVATASDRQPDVGDAFEVTLEVHNAGPQEATELQLLLNAGTRLAVSGVETTAGGCAVDTIITCELDDLASGETIVVNLSLVAMTRGAWHISGSANAWEEEPEPADNRVFIAGDNIPNADIAVHATTDVSAVRAGAQFGIDFGVTNRGPQVSTDVTISVALSGSGEFLAAPSCTADLHTLTCNVAELAVGESWSGTASVRAISGTSVSVQVLASSTEQDPVTADNSTGLSVVIDTPEPRSSGSNGGGCVYDPNGSRDTTLPAVLLLAMIVRWWSRRAVKATSTGGA